MSIQETLSHHIKQAFQALYDTTLETVEFQATRKDFEGDITVVVFPMLRLLKMNPVQMGKDLGQYLVSQLPEVKAYNVVKGFLNLIIDDSFYLNLFNTVKAKEDYGYVNTSDAAVMVEYSSPNTNKPLHLGHIRNNLLGYAIAEILKASGKTVYKTQIINDRGIHICKSMLAWKRYGNGETPESTGLKGDKLVGNYYVRFDKEYKAEISNMVNNGYDKEDAAKEAPILLEAQEMLRQWEAGDAETVNLWKTMNGWVYDGFDMTYKNLGVDFDALYYESNTYLLGKEFVAEGLKTGVFFTKDDGSVWCDLTDEGLDEKIVLRADGTAVYMTQDIGTAIQRIKDYPDVAGMVYTVGNEQDYHFKVLFLILKKLGFEWAKSLYHLSYGMVDLPSGKMKSREGTVVDADDLMEEMSQTAKEIALEKGKLDGYTEQEQNQIYSIIGLGALKYQMLKVDPKKRILFDPKESIDFNGDSGPFIQMIYVRTRAILRKAEFDWSKETIHIELDSREKEILKQLQSFPEVIQQAATQHSPAIIANYTYDLAKEYSSYYQVVPILGAEKEKERIFRVQLSNLVGQTIKNAFSLLGINVPERM
ncbi:MAG: arginine--tRNA ligase [Flavobacteriaceae bacterium]|nr:arginine--tRNA ligase [Flavobacteriaceae bacterium]